MTDPNTPPVPAPAPPAAIDLELIASDLADVEVALGRLDSGAYWIDEVTGDPLPESLLIARPTARRVSDG